MSYKTDINTAFAIKIGQIELPFGILCTVLAVRLDVLECDCSPIDGSPDLVNIRLRPIKGTTGQYVIPKMDSLVYISITEDGGFISMFSDVDKVVLSSDDYGGIPKVEELTDKLNNLENKVNSIISTLNANATIFNAHVHPYLNATTPATTSISATTETSVSGTLTPTQRQDIESGFTFHGKGS